MADDFAVLHGIFNTRRFFFVVFGGIATALLVDFTHVEIQAEAQALEGVDILTGFRVFSLPFQHGVVHHSHDHERKNYF
jgi:hypothetical protein